MLLLALKMEEEGARRHGIWPLEAEKGRTDTLLVPPDRTQPSGTLVSAWRGPVLLSGLPNCTLLKATKLWSSVTAATEN